MEISNAAADQLAEVIASYVNDNGDDRVQLIGEVLGEDSSGTTWVHILGGEQRTPVTSTNAKVHKGDIVYVVIGDGRADILGNVSRPSTDDTLAEVVQQRVVETERVVERIEATAITADSAEIQQLNADHAVIETLDSTYASIGSLTAATARIGDIEADYLKAADMTAEQARVGQLIAGKADVADLTAANARIDSLESTKADISFLESDYITAAAIEANYLHADMSNADVAWIQNGVIKDGSISNAMINDVSANKLTAGTINGSVINVTNLNADNITAGTINGQRIGEGSLSLDKLSEDVYTEQEVDSKLATMQAEIDGAIETWTGTAVPTLNNSPASNWTTAAVRDTHVGDVYFVVNSQSEQNGYNYRFTKTNGTYSWQLIKDSDVTNALQRLSTAEGKITTFDSDISTLKTDTGTLKTKTESLETRMSDAEDDILDKVDTTTFNEVSDTVDQHSQTITQMSQTLSNKADGSTVTALTTRVSKTEQDITGVNTTIGELQTTVESKADSSTVETVSNKLNTVSDTVDGHTQSITSINNTLETKADSSTVSTLTTKVNNVSDTVDGHTQTIGSMQTTQTQMQGKLDKTIVETTQLWYSKSSTDAPSKPTSQVTSTSTAGNAWRTVVPAYNASYPNYFYCYQWKYTDGTYGWSSVTRDIAMGESQERARTAISNAATADTKAGNAATAAATAQSTADTAKSTADTAKATADKNVKSSLQLWYTKANETAPAKPTSKVTSTSVSGNAWRTVVPTYSASYPYYFYCYQYELADGTYTWSDVVYDRATTENQSNSRSAVTGVSTLTTKTNEISDTVDGHTSQLSSITTTQTSIQGSAVKSTVQLWFTKANTTAPSKPTAHVTTNNASTANAWNLAVPTYNSSYPYYYYCYEHQLLNDTYTWSAVTRDIATEESQSTSRSAASAAAAADTKAGNAASAAAAADTKAGNAAAAAATADGKAVSAQNTANKNVRESQQLWYTKANSTAPAKPTSKVTSTATTGGAWTTRVPTYSDSYKHYFYCMQYVAADGTVTWSDVIYDQATTEAQSVARAASADLTEFHQEYATFKQTTQEFESTVGETYATKTALNATDSKIENLEIGGRNLFGYGSDCESLAGMNNTGFEVVTKDGYTCAHASGALKTTKYLYSKIPFTPRPEEYVTISGYVQINNITEGTTNPMCEFYPSGQTLNGTWRAPSLKAIYIDGVNTGSTYSIRFHRNISDTNWHHFAAVYQWPNYEFTANMPPAVYFRDCTGDLYVRHIKYERGNKATDWTPAPEDTELAIDSIEMGGRNYAATNFERFPIGTSETRQSGVTATLTGPSTFTLNGNCTTQDWFFSRADVFGGLTLKAGTYKVWCTSSNVNIRVGVGNSGNTWFAAGGHCTRDNPFTLEIATEQAYYFTPYANNGDSFNNQEVRLMVERGSKPTDWSPAPEDTDSQLSSIEERVSTAETSITNNSREIGLRAKASDVYTKAQSDGLIATEVTNRNAAIKESADAIKLTVSQTYTTKEDFRNLEIGGTNLLRKSKDLSKGSPLRTNVEVGRYGDPSFVEVDGGFIGVSTTTSAWRGVYVFADTLGLSVGDVVTFSCNIKTTDLTGTVNYYTMAYDSSGTRTYPNTPLSSSAEPEVTTNNMKKVLSLTANTDVRVWLTLEWSQAAQDTLDAGGAFRMTFQTSSDLSGSGTVTFYAPKLEKGNKATDWSPSPLDVEDSIDGISVGGRNLFSNTATLEETWVADNGSAGGITINEGIASLPASKSARIYQLPANGYWTWEANTEYVVSIEARSTTSGGMFTFNMVGASNNDSKQKTVDVTTNWKRYSWAFTSHSTVGSGSASFYNSSNSTAIQFRRPKLERGNKGTEWSPAPEDLDSHFESVESSITQTADSITESVEKKYATKDESRLDIVGTGASVGVDSAASADLKGLVVRGESSQDGTPTPSAPKPIYSVGSPNTVSNSDVRLTSTYGSKTDSTSCVLTKTIPKGTVVIVSCHIEATNVTWAGSGSRRAGVEINQPTDGTSSGTQYVGVWWGLSGSNHQGSDANFSGTISAPVTLTRDFVANGSRALGVYIQNMTGGSITVSEPSLTVGYFKPYVPSDSIAILVKGRNMLGLATAGRYTNVVSNGVTWTMNDDGTISANGTSTAISQVYWSFSEEESYSFDGMELTGAPNVSGCSIRLEKNVSPYTAHAVDTGSGATVSFPSGADGVCFLFCRVESGKTVDVTFRPMIRRPSQPNEYEPYRGTVVPIPMNGHELRGLPDGTQDELTVDVDGHVTMTQRVMVRDLGTWNFSRHSSYGYFYHTITDKALGWNNLLCSAYSLSDAAAASMPDKHFKGSTSQGAVFYMDNDYSDTTSFKAAMNGVEIHYALATPQTIDLGTIDMPQVKDGDTVEVIAALTPSIDATWWASAGQAVADAYASLSSAIEVRAESIVSTVSERYATSDEVKAISSQIEQTAQGWGIQFKNLLGTPADGQSTEGMTLAKAFEQLGVTEGNLEQIRSYVRIAEETVDNQTYPVLLMGSSNSPIMLALSNKALEFRHGDEKVAYIDVNGETDEGMLHITRAVVVKELQFGSWKWFERDGVGNLALKWVGDE